MAADSPETPQNYFRIVSPTFTFPEAEGQTLPVGILACQRDPLLLTLKTRIVSCTIHQPPLPAKKLKKGGDVQETYSPTLEVITHDTVIFPEGGGQPSDIGTITTVDGNAWEVVQCKRHGGHAVHYVTVKNIPADLDSFLNGSNVSVALGHAGFKRRYDHMTMHTGQHMLSALLHSHFRLPTLSWSLTAYPSPCYIDVGRAMTASEIGAIQEDANRLVFEGRAVHVEVEELHRSEESKAAAPSAAEIEGGYRGRATMPVDYTGGVNRVVFIDGIDRTPCCGTHLPSLHNLQVFLVPHMDSTGRLFFYAGPRLIEYISSCHSLLASAAGTLATGASSVPERVAQVLDERKKGTKRVEALEDEVADSISKRLLMDMESGAGAEPDNLFVKHIHRIDDSPTPLTLLTNISMRFQKDPGVTSTNHLIVLTSSPSIPRPDTTTVALVFGSNVNHVKSVGDAFRAKGLKGGGKGTKWSGKSTGPWKAVAQDVEQALKTITP